MSVKSMTGYAATSAETSAGTLTIELKSVNSRFLDLQFRMGDELRVLEPVLREAITQHVTRGKIECRLGFSRNAKATASYEINAALLEELARLQDKVRKQFPQAKEFTVNELLKWPGMVEEAGIEQEKLQEQIRSEMHIAITSFIDARNREGQALVVTLLDRVNEMEKIVSHITPLIPQMVSQFQQKAIERMQEALNIATSHGTITPVTSRDEVLDRIRQEVTLYGMRIDVSEELSRLAVHLEEIRQIMKKGGPVGKRLDFILQELNREANTLGSKAAIRELSDASVNLKLLIEQIREQVQNLE